MLYLTRVNMFHVISLFNVKNIAHIFDLHTL